MAITKATASSIAPAAKGDLVAGSATNDAAVLGVGANNTVLTADSAEATGLKWATPAAASFVGCRLSNTNETVSIANNTNTILAFNQEIIDTDSFHDNSTNNSRITIPAGKAGKYLIMSNIYWAGNATQVRIMDIMKNGNNQSTVAGSGQSSSAGSAISNQAAIILDLAVSDYIEFRVSQNSGGALNVYFDNGIYGWVQAIFLGA